MLRTTATRSLVKSFAKVPTSRSSYSAASATFRNAAPLRQLSNKRPQDHPTTRSIRNQRKKVAESKLEPHPEAVSTASSAIPVFESGPKKEDDADMMAGIKSDVKTIKETFSLNEVPRESLYIGAAGVIPYAATSLSTVYLAWDINHANANGTGVLFSPETAHQLLEWITPIQIGYGAVIISFLGAIHWGLEYAGYGGYHSYRRYMYGVIAPAVAWPTIFMPVEYALITQFLAFNFLYFADARATVRGWFPAWYSTYRFVLTFFVGASIVATLVGRGQIVREDHTLKSPVDYIKSDRDAQWEALEREEKERRLALEKESEEEDAEAEEGGEEEGDEEGKDEEGKESKEGHDDKKEAK
ncbi:hypothetical protein LSUB1_G007019 [Lachnellula subtilissima]|uniref:Mitochondrial inner membrane protein 1 n=1 Tax=Lachnellula subtilissima TaxID=602034 RepID=A0A8H8U6L8_9HELO|nr:hypothetical protein LSUB1_G007019 [Lachnellula subtilissima]